MIADLMAKFAGLAPKVSWGGATLFFNPGGVLPSSIYFCTVKGHDGANDKASQLD